MKEDTLVSMTIDYCFKLYQSKQPPPVPEDVILSEEADDFRRKCFAMYVIFFSRVSTHLVLTSGFHSNPEDRPSAAALRKHSYLILPPDWVFTGFT